MAESSKSGKRPELVLLDIGGVLVRLRTPREAFADTLHPPGASWSADRFEESFRAFRESPVFDRFERGRIGVGEFCEAVRGHFGIDLPDAEIRAGYERLVGGENEGALALVRDVKKAGMRVAALSDVSEIHLAILPRAAVIAEIGTIIASCRTGLRKPDVATFADAARRLGVEPASVFFADDAEPNVAGARGAGMRAELFTGIDALRHSIGL